MSTNDGTNEPTGASQPGHGDGDDPEAVLAAPPRTGASGDAVVARPPGRHLQPLTLGLIALVLVAVAFLGGMLAQKHFGKTAAATTRFGFRPGASGAPGGFGQGPGGGAGGGFAFGTVTKVDGSTLYIQTANGQTITVTTTGSTTVRVTTTGQLSDLKLGSTVVVQGAQSGSTIAATTVSEGGGFPGRGGFGGGFGGSPAP